MGNICLELKYLNTKKWNQMYHSYLTANKLIMLLLPLLELFPIDPQL